MNRLSDPNNKEIKEDLHTELSRCDICRRARKAAADAVHRNDSKFVGGVSAQAAYRVFGGRNIFDLREVDARTRELLSILDNVGADGVNVARIPAETYGAGRNVRYQNAGGRLRQSCRNDAHKITVLRTCKHKLSNTGQQDLY